MANPLMETSIQLKKTTKQRLARFKVKEGVASYDKAVEQLLEKQVEIPDMFGVFAKNPIKFSKEDEMDFDHERTERS